MQPLEKLLQESARLHHHLCPRQVLGVRMGLLGGEVLGVDVPQTNKRLLTIVETDGCASDGISVASGCWVGRRTLRIEDYGKVAATFVDTQTEAAVRIAPRPEARRLAGECLPDASNPWEAQLLGYQHLPADALLSVTPVKLAIPVAEIISRPGVKAICSICGEEILNQREVTCTGVALCRACAGQAYYRPLSAIEHPEADSSRPNTPGLLPPEATPHDQPQTAGELP